MPFIFLTKNSPFFISFLFFSSLSLFLVCLSETSSVLQPACLLVLGSCLSIQPKWGNGSLFLAASGTTALFCLGSSSVLSLFIYMEVSTFFILLSLWTLGPRPERWVASAYILSFNICPSSIHFVGLSAWIDYYGSWSFSVGEHIWLPLLMACLLCFSYAVNSPCYGLHFWLPKAHVEADTASSMLLGGVSLNIGWFGFNRVIYSTSIGASGVVLTLFVTLSAVSTIAGVCHPDMKCIIAYCSVVHITLSIFLLLRGDAWSVTSSYVLAVSHCFSCPALFFWSGMSGVRNTLLFTRQRPRFIFGSFWFLVSVLVISAGNGVPPFASFLGEARTASICVYTSFLMFFIVFFCILLLFLSFFVHLMGGTSPAYPAQNSGKISTSASSMSYVVFLVLLSPLLLIFFGGGRYLYF